MEYFEQSKDKTKCQYWLVMKSCRDCLFETLCRLEKIKCKPTIWNDLYHNQ